MNIRKIIESCSSNYKLSVFDSIGLVNKEDWNKLSKSNIYLSIAYLKSIEESMPEIDYRYVMVYDKELQAVMLAYFQIIDFKGLDKVYKDWLEGNFGESIVKKLLPKFDLRVMVCGNLFVCGENGFSYSEELAKSDAMNLLADTMSRIGKSNEKNEKSSILLIKELFPENDPSMLAFAEDKFYPFHIDCNMILRIDKSWNSIDDYYNSMTSKFRTKAKAAFKKSQALEVQSWSSVDIIENQKEVNELHQQVVDKAEFSLGELNALSFSALKNNLKELFEFKAYLLNNELIGFSAAFIGDGFVDAAHVGIDYQYNVDYALYQRMLHDFVDLAMQKGSEEVRFGRTAEQIKSTLGAEPVNMRLYIKHKNSVVNHLLKPVIDTIKPSKFQMRQPFKAEYYN